MVLHRILLVFVIIPSGEKYLIFCFLKCVNELLFTCQKLSEFSKTCFTMAKQTALATFNLYTVYKPSKQESARHLFA